MKHRAIVKPVLLLLVLVGFLLGACRQDAVFDIISNESAPVEPRIKGSPTNMVIFGSRLYVGQGSSLNSYTSAGWNRGNDISRDPGGSMYNHALASAGGNLYAVASGRVVRNGGGTGGSWTALSGDNDSIQNAFSAEDGSGTVFVGRQVNSGRYDIYYVNNASSSALVSVQPNAGLLSGAASNGSMVYASTDRGIYCFSTSSSSVSPAGTILSGTSIKGMINTGSGVVAVSSNGTVYEINGASANSKGNVGGSARSALASWQSSGTLLLLVGIEGSSYDSGYREFVMSSGASKVPGESPSTVVDRNAYKSSLGQHKINFLCQAPDGVLFAATVGEGLWSCRNGKWQAEE